MVYRGRVLKERTPTEQAAYWDGYNMACKVLNKQMLDKMEHYRSMLRDAFKAIPPTSENVSLRIRIGEELSLNPKWEVLKNLPHMEFPGPDAYKAINTGPEPK